MATQTAEQQLAARREAKILELEQYGVIDPDCPGCQRDQYPFYRNEWKPGKFGPMAPNHLASKRCESGRRNHCTCPSCF